MITAHPATIEYVRSADLLRYVKAHGWTRLEALRARGPYEFYSPPRPDDAGRVHRLALPTSDDAKDLRDAVSQVVGISAAIEHRLASDVVADMMSVAVDAIDVRIIPPHGGSRILLSSAPGIYSSLQELLIESAKAERKADDDSRPKGSKSSPTPTGNLWLLPAVPRSFAFRIESVIGADTTSMLGVEPVVPIAHKAVCRVVKGLQQSRDAVEHNGWGTSEQALTAPMRDALVELHGAVGGSDVEFSHDLSPRYEAPQGVGRVGSVRYTTSMALQLRQLQTNPPSEEDPTIDTLTVTGEIVELKNRTSQPERDKQLELATGGQEYDPDKNVVHILVTGARGGLPINNLYFSLLEQQYRDACAAHATGKPIRVTGRPRFNKGKWVLDPVYEFIAKPTRSRAKKA